MAIDKSAPIAIVGAGVFGLTSALQLANDGYSDIAVFEQDSQMPSRSSAGFDLNKIVRPEYEDPWYTELALSVKKAVEGWKTPFYAPHYHQTGFLHLVSGAAPSKALDTLNRFRATIDNHPLYKDKLVPVSSRDDIQRITWQYSQGAFPGWNGYFNPQAGYAHSANALLTVYQAAAARGVKFFLGAERGAVTEILYNQSHRAIGVRVASGKFHPADLTIIAAGAAAAKLVPDVGKQVIAKSWSVAHLQLTDEETSALRGVPVTYARDLGFFFEPDPKTNLLKLCPMGGGYANTDPASGVSLPPGLEASDDVLPAEDERKLRQLVREALPQFADRKFVEKRLCWFADTDDSDFIVDYVPGTANSVVVCSGDSGHLFKMLPVVGEWVQKLVESNEQAVLRWRWKGDRKEKKGGEVSWRLGETREFKEVKRRESKL